MTATATDEVKVQAARALWRADLLKLHASEFQRLAGDDASPTAQGLLASATSKEAEATIHEDLAEAQLRHSAAKQARDADPKDPAAKRRYDEAAAALQELRSYWRGIDEYTGGRESGRVGYIISVDNFPEPTDDEVLASHGGTN